MDGGTLRDSGLPALNESEECLDTPELPVLVHWTLPERVREGLFRSTSTWLVGFDPKSPLDTLQVDQYLGSGV
jgi:hypothetical protein